MNKSYEVTVVMGNMFLFSLEVYFNQPLSNNGKQM